MQKRILINREEREVRVAFLEDQTLVELHTEKADEQTIVNNIYRGRVQDVVPGLQAAFVDVGLSRNMFLHFMDIRPESLVLGEKDQIEALRKASETVVPGRIERKGRRPRQDPNAPQASAPVKKGDQIIVQVLKDEIGGKAPRVTTNLSLAGRYLVMLPFPSQSGGVSRKIAMGQDRSRLRKLLSDLKTDDYSFIVRTAGTDQPDEAIHKDAENLQQTWDSILKRYRQINGPGLVNNDHDLIARLVRDAFPADFDEVICDNADDVEEAKFQLEEVLPGSGSKVKLYDGVENIFECHGVEKQIEKSLAKKYWLKSGGYLIIDENEALTAIDVNTGRFTGKKDQEKTSLRTNMEACEAIADQIRLRDIGGIIVIDFIDMLSRAHQDRVSEEMRKHLRRDRAKTAIGRIGDFGIMMLTRKRQRMSLLHQLNDECPYCTGTGYVLKADETFRKVKYEILKVIGNDQTIGGVLVSGHQRLVDALQSQYGNFRDELKRDWHCDVSFRIDPDFHIEDFMITPLKRTDRGGLRVGARVEEDQRVQEAVYESEAPAPPSPQRQQRPVPQQQQQNQKQQSKSEQPHRERQQRPPREDRRHQQQQNHQQQQKAAQQAQRQHETEPHDEYADVDSGDMPSQKPLQPGEPAVTLTPDGRPRRRHRESSAERRARRRRAREMAVEGLPAPSPVPLEDDEEADEAADHVSDTQQNEAASEPAPATPSQGHVVEGKKKTRRGSRGGRNRRKRGREEAELSPAEAAPAQDSAVSRVDSQPLRLTRPAGSDPLGSLLDNIEQQLSSLKELPPQEASPAEDSPAQLPLKRAKRKLRRGYNADDADDFGHVTAPADDDDDDPTPLLLPEEKTTTVPHTKPVRKARPKRTTTAKPVAEAKPAVEKQPARKAKPKPAPKKKRPAKKSSEETEA